MSTPSEPLDPFAADAPILHLLSLRDHPHLADASDEEIRAVCERLKGLVQQPATLDSQLRTESAKAKTPRTPGISARKKSILDTI